MSRHHFNRRAAMVAATLVVTSLPAVLAVQPAGATAQPLSCGIGGNQTMNATGIAPATVAQGSDFTVDLQMDSAVAAGGSIANMTWNFVAPAGSTIVPGSTTTVGSGSGTLGAVTTAISGSTAQLKIAGPIANGASFQAPLFRFQLNASGAVGTALSVKVPAAPTAAYTLRAAGLFDISCTAATPVAFTTTNIVAATTAPGAPTGVTATPGNASASVSWTAPASDGGSAITGYTVTPYIGATAQTPQVFDASATTRNITGLTNGTAYTFTVAATNAVGTGTPSTASAAVTPISRKAPADFDGDGKTDVAVFRPSNGGWFVSGSPVTYLGLDGDVPVPADYAHDGTSDRAIWRPSTGAWFVDGVGSPTYHGIDGDVPVPGDYDGNGTADRAVWRPSNGGWYIHGQGVTYLGLSTDVPVPADYDGDGTTDMAVFRPSTGAWYVQGEPVQYFGAAGDVPLPGDYDDDGTTDLAVFRPSQGAWYIDGAETTYFGLGTDTPVPGQYDDDDATDIAVFRPANGGWYIDGQSATFFGLDGDVPAPRNPALA